MAKLRKNFASLESLIEKILFMHDKTYGQAKDNIFHSIRISRGNGGHSKKSWQIDVIHVNDDGLGFTNDIMAEGKTIKSALNNFIHHPDDMDEQKPISLKEKLESGEH